MQQELRDLLQGLFDKHGRKKEIRLDRESSLSDGFAVGLKTGKDFKKSLTRSLQ